MSFGKYYHFARINLINSFAYIADLITLSLFIALIIFIFSSIWKVVYANNGSDGIVNGFTIVMVMWYFLMTESIVNAHSKVIDEIGSEVRSGEVANHINKPYNYILYKYAISMGGSIVKFFLTFIVGSIVVLLTVGAMQFDLETLPFIAIVVFLALTLNFMIMAFIAIFAFWLEETQGLEFIYQKIAFTIGGMFIPFEFFPSWLAQISLMLPFGYVAYFPAKLFVSYSADLFIQVLVCQLIWITLFVLASMAIYNVVLKKVSVNGG